MKRVIVRIMGVALALAWGLAPAVASAADAPAPGTGALVLQVSPLPINLEADPGKSVSADLRVKQNSGSDARLKVSLMKFRAYGEEGKPELMDRQPGDDYFDWVKFDKTQFDAPANVWQTVKMTINVPKTAAFGYYYAVAFSRVGDDVKRGERTNSVAGAAATLVLLDARSPNAKRTLGLASFTSMHRIYEFLPADFKVAFKNTGNVHVVPHGDVFIMRGNKQLGVVPINSAFGNILPGSNRVYPSEWTEGFPVYEDVVEDGKVKLDKNGNHVQKLKWDWTQLTKLRIGRYTGHLFAVYDDGKRDVPIEADVSFWVIPWRFLAVLAVVLAIVGFGVYSVVRGTLRGARRLGRRRR
ncbi:MAG TPA: hypothetical protein VMT30_00215 [Candidatus Saccharimonadia bacterium]|nr:hypothetical protein [Candidatus Saccharimonadia bacterium]